MNISASPYHRGKGAEREQMLAQRARDSLAYVVYCNLVGGQDELVFDGYSLVIDQDGELIARGAQFEEDLVVCDIDPSTAEAARLRDARHRPRGAAAAAGGRRARAPVGSRPPRLDRGRRPAREAARTSTPRSTRRCASACATTSTRTGSRGVLLGLSGGIDSALTACDRGRRARAPSNVRCAVMPSPYSSRETQQDARTLADNLGIERFELRARAADARLRRDARPRRSPAREPDVTEENIQARIRGNLLMALSNKFGWLVLTTGNKSEISVGYTTLYGDMAGGFAVLKDVPKTLVYRLAHYRNTPRRRP